MSWTLSGRWAESPACSDISNQSISRVAVSTMTNLPSDEVEPSRKPCDHDERRSHLRQRYQMPTIPAKYCDESEQNEHPTQSTDRVVPNHTKVATTSSQHVLRQKFDQQTKDWPGSSLGRSESNAGGRRGDGFWMGLPPSILRYTRITIHRVILPHTSRMARISTKT